MILLAYSVAYDKARISEIFKFLCYYFQATFSNICQSIKRI